MSGVFLAPYGTNFASVDVELEAISGTFVSGSYVGGMLNPQSGGGTFFNAAVSGTTMTGSSDGSFPGTFTLSRQ